LDRLALSLRDDKQLDIAEETAFRVIALLPKKGQEYQACLFHQTLGKIYRSKGEIEKAIHHYEVALRIASPFNWHDHLFWIHYKLAGMFRNQGRLDNTQAHLERVELHAVDNAYCLGRVMQSQARALYKQHGLEDARTEVLRAADVYEKLGAAKDVGYCRDLLQRIENSPVASDQPALNCESLQTILSLTRPNLSF